MKHFHKLLTALLLAPLPALSAAAASNDHARPNIIVIMADDLGSGDMSCAGATKVRTPNIDRLAADGVRFTQGYAPSATCTPSRYSLLTGEYAWRQKAKVNSILDGDAPLCIEPGRFTLPEMLRQAGYRTGVVGKWHLGLGDGETKVDFNKEVKPGPLEVGFDDSYIIPATVDRVPSVWVKNHKVVGLDPADPIEVSYLKNISDEPTGIDRPDLLTHYGADEQHSCTIINGISRIGYMKGGKAARFKDEELATTVVRESVDFIERNAGKPFFLSVGLFEPHVPRVAEPPFVGKSGTGVRGDVIAQVDWQVGEILGTLDRLGLAENTIVIFSSDNGPILFDGYYDRSVEDLNGHNPTGGLRGWKYQTFEGGCRVPFIVRWPSEIKPRVSNQLISLVDVIATVAAITNQEIPTGTSPDSIDLSAVLLGKTLDNVRDHTVQHGVAGTKALRKGNWKYLPATAKDAGGGMGTGANASDERFAAAFIPEPMLFDLATDPGETTNVIGQHPEKAKELAAELASIVSNGATPKPAASKP